MILIFIYSNYFNNEFERNGFCLVNCVGISDLSLLSKLSFLNMKFGSLGPRSRYEVSSGFSLSTRGIT